MSCSGAVRRRSSDVRRLQPFFGASPSDSESARTTAQNAPLGRFGTNSEAVPGPVQFKLRTPEAT
eukprot:418892-Alexandrium_andersonii.AAC.1